MKGTGKQSLKAANKERILRVFIGRRNVSRADIARDTGLSQAALSHLLEELAAEGRVQVTGHALSKGGRRAALYSLCGDGACVLGVSLSPEGLQASVVNTSGTMIRNYTDTGPFRGNAAWKAVVARMADFFSRSDGGPPFSAVAVSAPGLVDFRTGAVLRSALLDLEAFPLAECLSGCGPGLPLYLFRDTDARLLWEYTFIHGEPEGCMLYLLCDQDTSASVLLDGELLSRRGCSLELGGAVLGRAATWGDLRQYTVNAQLSAPPAIERYCILYEKQYEVPYYGRLSLSFGELVSMHLTGDTVAEQVVDEQMSLLTATAANLVNLFSPGCMVVSSPLCRLEKDFGSLLGRRIEHLVPPPLTRQLRIVRADAGQNALLGMANYVLKHGGKLSHATLAAERTDG